MNRLLMVLLFVFVCMSPLIVKAGDNDKSTTLTNWQMTNDGENPAHWSRNMFEEKDIIELKPTLGIVVSNV